MSDRRVILICGRIRFCCAQGPSALLSELSHIPCECDSGVMPTVASPPIKPVRRKERGKGRVEKLLLTLDGGHWFSDNLHHGENSTD